MQVANRNGEIGSQAKIFCLAAVKEAACEGEHLRRRERHVKCLWHELGGIEDVQLGLMTCFDADSPVSFAITMCVRDSRVNA